MKLIEELDTSTKKDIIIEGLMRSKGVYLLVSKPKVGSLCWHCNFPTVLPMDYHF